MPHPIAIRQTATGIEVDAASYRWRWSRASDAVTLSGADGRTIVEYPLQPVIEVAGDGAMGRGGRCDRVTVDGTRVDVQYAGVNGAASLALTLRFHAAYFVLEDVTYTPAAGEAIVRIVYFGAWSGGAVAPAAVASTCVIPGGRQSPEQAIFHSAAIDDQRYSVGYFGLGTGEDHQQWALPHYLVACYDAAADGAPASHAACTGLGALPDGHALVRIDRGRFCYEINVRGDLWGHKRGPAPQRFAAPLVIAVAPDWYSAGLAHFDALFAEGYARRKGAEDVPASASLPQFDTWGDQIHRRAILERFDESHLREIYAAFRASGLASKLFVIDDKWEHTYGSLEHDSERFPRFIDLLDEIRAGGVGIGLWTAFPRCEDFRALGLTEDAVLMTPDGQPYVERQRKRSWYIFDPTNAGAAAYLADRARHLVRTYRPAMVKIDFGYEIPLPDVAGPHDPSQGGERLLLRFLEVIVGAIKREDPSIAILYYCLTPLLNDYLDQTGADDMWMSRGAYGACFAKRALLSSWCGAFGVVPYGSSGYDWRSAEEIWLDTAVIGTPGIIAPVSVPDEYGDRLTPALTARYNGVARITRSNPHYTIERYDADLDHAAAGPRARSWARIEDGEAVVIALRPPRDGTASAPGIAAADGRTVIASLTSAGIRESAALAIVPFDPANVTIALGRRPAPRAIAHLLGGAAHPLDVRTGAEAVTLHANTTTHDGTPVEWIELRFGTEGPAT
jgi:hypothetical protein